MIREHDDCNCNSSNPLNTLAKYKENKTAEKDIFAKFQTGSIIKDSRKIYFNSIMIIKLFERADNKITKT